MQAACRFQRKSNVSKRNDPKQLTQIQFLRASGPFLESPANSVLGLVKPYKNLGLTITELFYSHILSMSRGSGAYTSLFLDTDELIMAQ